MTNPPAGARQRRSSCRPGRASASRSTGTSSPTIRTRARSASALARGPRSGSPPRSSPTGRRPRSLPVGSVMGLAKLAPGPGNVGLAEREEREPGAGEVLLEVRGAGICGTDLHIEADEFASVPPVTMGHEVCGVVAAVGEGVDAAWLGARVVSETYFSTCGICEWCRDGQHQPLPGAALDRLVRRRGVRAAGRRARAEPPPRSRTGSTSTPRRSTEPLACVCHCLLRPAAVAAGDRVLVTGPGPDRAARRAGGASAAAATCSSSACRRTRVRLEAARGLGLDDGARWPSRARADVVVECSGAAGGAPRRASRRAARAPATSRSASSASAVTVPLDHVFQKELVVTSGFASTPRSWRRALALIETAERSSSSRSSARSFRSTTWERVVRRSARGQGHQDRVRSATWMTGRGNRPRFDALTDQGRFSMKIGLLDRPVQRQAARGGGGLRRRARLRDGRARRLARARTTSTRTARPRTRRTARASRRCSPTTGSRSPRSPTTSPRRWCCRSATRASTSGPAPPTRRRWSSSARSTSSRRPRSRPSSRSRRSAASSARRCGRAGTSGRRSASRSTKQGWELFVERWSPILDRFKELGVRFAHEVHPTEIAYNVYTAEEAIKRLDRDDWGFNFDPSHLDLADDRPGRLHQEVRQPDLPRHAKDWELQKDILHIDGVTSDRLVAAARPRSALPRARLGRRRVEARHDRAARGRATTTSSRSSTRIRSCPRRTGASSASSS